MEMSLNGVFEHAGMNRPCQGEKVSGDAVVTLPLDGGIFVAIVDVLGHGPEAHELARTIDTYLGRYASTDISGLMIRLHQHLKGARGAVGGLCSIDAASGRATYAGTGNTVLRHFGKTERFELENRT